MSKDLLPAPPGLPAFPTRRVVEQTRKKFNDAHTVRRYLIEIGFDVSISEDAEVNALDNYMLSALAGKVHALHNKRDISELSSIEFCQLRLYVRKAGKYEALAAVRSLGHDRRHVDFLPSKSISSIDDMEAGMSLEELRLLLEGAVAKVSKLSMVHQQVFQLMYEQVGKKKIMTLCGIGHERCTQIMRDLEKAVLGN